MLPVTRSRPLPDVVCFSHLRWNFVFQRPQHLMTRCARDGRVFYVEEPAFHPGVTPHLHIERTATVTVVVPQLPEGLAPERCRLAERALVDELLLRERVTDYVL